MAAIPDTVRSKLEQKTFWHLATINEDGSATTTPVWVDVDGGGVIVNTAIGRLKERNVRRDPRVALSMTDFENPYDWVEIRGRVVELVEGEPAEASIDALARKYIGSDYPYRQPGERRVIMRIEPTRVVEPPH
ncbi:MAG: PPOX class F420-dependent oxidoreductase [Thermoleophilia bacterium]|nr:PPOX class F420-dependent oxidoreductase [Thermoleophilia bacterium]